MELWKNLDRRAVEAAQDEATLDRFTTESKNFILRCASKTCRRFITESDDEFEIALAAFVEAVRTYNPQAGGFRGFAALTIKGRLTDSFDKLRHRTPEALADSAMAWGEGAEVQKVIAQSSLGPEHTVKDEIDAMSGILKEYGFSFFDIAEASPRSKRTRGCCARAVNWMLDPPARILRMRQRRSLPVMELSSACDISHKVVDRHRRYIIAAAEILDGDFPQLSEYLRYIKRDDA